MIKKGNRTVLKAGALIIALLMVLSACAPGNSNVAPNNSVPSGQGGNTQPSGNTEPGGKDPSGNEADPYAGLSGEEKLYRQLKDLCDAAWNKGEGVLKTGKTYSMTTSVPGGASWDSEGTEVYTTSFYTGSDGSVEMVRLLSADGGEPSDGELQYKGIKYKYTRRDHERDTVEWVEGAAQAGCTELPALESLMFRLPEFEELDSIKFEYSCYKLSVGKSFFRVLAEDSSVNSAYYTLSNVSAEYYLDGNGDLAGCSWMYTESWSASGASVTDNVSAEIELLKDETPLPATWFRDSTTYVRPEYPEITETAREAHYNIPGKIVFDVRIPKIKDGLTGADKLNKTIEKDLEYEMTMDEASLSAAEYSDYISRKADYSVIKIGKFYEILVDCSVGSAEGSGAATWGHRYFYVSDKGGPVSAEEFLKMMGYDQEAFLAAADEDELYTDYSGRKMSEDFTYEELLGMFYFDEEAELVFAPDLMF